MISVARVFVLTCLLVGCSTSALQPEWVDQPASRYPADSHLTAVGSARDRGIADRAALAKLSQQFEVAVQDTVSDQSIARRHSSGREETTENIRRSARHTTTFSERVLEGARIVDHWQHEVDDQARHYSLAILAKAPLEQRLRTDIRSADRRIERWIDYERDQARTPVQALSALHKARQQSIERQRLNRDLITVTGSGIPAPSTTDVIAQTMQDRLTSLTLHPVASASWQSLLESSIKRLGMNQGQGNGYQLRMTLDHGPVEPSPNWLWLRGSLELELTQAGSTVASVRDAFKVSSSKTSDIHVRLRDQLAEKVPLAIFQLLVSSDPGIAPDDEAH